MENKNDSSSRHLGRRRFIQRTAALAASGALNYIGLPDINKDDIKKLTVKSGEDAPKQVFYRELPITEPLAISPFKEVVDFQPLKSVEGWETNRLKEAINIAVKKSEKTKEEVVVNLPEGEIVVDHIVCKIPEGAAVRLQGHENGTRIKLNPDLSDVNKNWGSFGERNALFFQDMDGELTLEGIQFNGGSEKAGKYGYKPPESPWDSVVLVVGSGAGSLTKPPTDRLGNRHGKVNIKDCQFQSSESCGFMAQNLHTVVVDGIEGKNLDALVTSSWCDDVLISNARGQNFPSDGFYITGARTVQLVDCQMKTARQGYDLQGVKSAILENCQAYDTAIAYCFAKSESDGITNCGSAVVTNCDSEGSASIFSVGPIDTLRVQGGKHDRIAEDWMQGYENKDFLHTDAIQNPLAPIVNPPIVIYGDEGKMDVTFANTQVRFSGTVLRSSTKISGIQFSRERSPIIDAA